MENVNSQSTEPDSFLWLFAENEVIDILTDNM